MRVRNLPILMLLVCVPSSSWGQHDIPLDMSQGWIRRDWQECADRSVMRNDQDRLQISTDSSAALYWQVPTKSGPLAIDTSQGWIQECDRPPKNFAQTVSRSSSRSALLSVSEHRYFTWKWNVSNTIDDTNTIDNEGRVQRVGDDFAAKIGISILKKGTDDPREISYIWTKSLPEESILVHEKRVLFWKFQYHRIVVESGDKQVGQWVIEARDLYADYKRIYPNEEPGEIVRIYVMSDSDNTDSQVTGQFADFRFSCTRPKGLSPSE